MGQAPRGLGTGLNPTLLWANDNEGAEFGAQTITVDGLSKYTFVIVVCYVSIYSAAQVTVVARRDESICVSQGGNASAARIFSPAVDGDTIYIADCRDNSDGVKNWLLPPRYIYGLR